MIIEYFHVSKYGNGIKVAEEFKRILGEKSVTVNVHHVKKIKPQDIPQADLYVFSSPGRFGKPDKSMRKFLEKIELTTGTRYALLTTQMAPKPDKKTGRLPTEEETGQKIIPMLNEFLQSKGLEKVAEERIFVIGTKGPLEDDWQKKVEDFAGLIPVDN
jgi:flavodoxin